MKWVMVFFICGPEICSTYIADTRYMNENHCQMMFKNINPKELFKLNDKDETLAQFCMQEAELSHLTEKVLEDL